MPIRAPAPIAVNGRKDGALFIRLFDDDDGLLPKPTEQELLANELSELVLEAVLWRDKRLARQALRGIARAVAAEVVVLDGSAVEDLYTLIEAAERKLKATVGAGTVGEDIERKGRR
jgi:hypothetical protein